MNHPLAGNQFDVGLSAWIIQDGNYGNFHVGQNAAFALEFYYDAVAKSPVPERSFQRVSPAKYQVNAEVVFATEELSVLDFGLRAFEERKPRIPLTRGSFISAEIFLGIDPFFYFESLYALGGMPPLIYEWKIDSIFQQTAPFIEDLVGNQKMLVRDPKKLDWKVITKTDAWSDDNGHAEYVLQCSLANSSPKSEFLTNYRLS